MAERRTQARRKTNQELVALGELRGGKLDQQDAGTRHGSRQLSELGAKARFDHVVKDANPAHLFKVDLRRDDLNFEIDDAKPRYLELLDGKLLLVTNTDAPATDVVQRFKSLVDIEHGCRVLKPDIENGPEYNWLPRRIRAHALVCFMALIMYRVLRIRLKAHKRKESPTRLLQPLQCIHQQTVRTVDRAMSRGLLDA